VNDDTTPRRAQPRNAAEDRRDRIVLTLAAVAVLLGGAAVIVALIGLLLP
jgi:hypothetical protein